MSLVLAVVVSISALLLPASADPTRIPCKGGHQETRIVPKQYGAPEIYVASKLAAPIQLRSQDDPSLPSELLASLRCCSVTWVSGTSVAIESLWDSFYTTEPIAPASHAFPLSRDGDPIRRPPRASLSQI
jgi:hypothetical protein